MKGGRTLSQSRGRSRSSPKVRSRRSLQGASRFSAPLHPLLQLQQTIGNQAVARLIQAKLKISQSGDKSEEEADRMADTVMRMGEPTQQVQEEAKDEEQDQTVQRASLEDQEEKIGEESEHEPIQAKLMPGHTSRLVQRQDQPEEKEESDDMVQTKASPSSSPTRASNLEAGIQGLKGSGQPLSPKTRNFFEPRFGQDFSHVQVHTGPLANKTASDLNAKAFAIGRDVAFNSGQYAPQTKDGRRLIAHELTHVIQQENGGRFVQRYEAGEHAQLGETQAELKKDFLPTSYLVQKGDRLSGIAKKFGITVAELKATNRGKLKRWPAVDGSGRLIEGFNAGEMVAIPQKLNDFAKAAIKNKSAKFMVNGVVLDYGVGIAKADLFESPEQMAKASPQELKDLAKFIRREQSGGKAVTTEEWQKASRGRYLKLAEKNVAHFAPPSPGLVKPSPAGGTSANHKSAWEKHHNAALEVSKSGDKDKALLINAFGDHFLTDAFSAGHLVNKRDVMEQFKSQLKLDAKGKEFTKSSKKFFDTVAKAAFTGSVKTEFSKYETVEFKGVIFRPNINSVSRFSGLLQAVHKEESDLLANAVAKGVHDKLNTISGGLPVENAKGDSWKLSGDGTLNTKTKEIALKAVARSQLNIISVYKLTGPLNIPDLHKEVWDYTPKPSVAGTKQLVNVVEKGTDVKSADLKKAVVKLIKDNYKLMIDQLVKRKKLKKA